MHPIAAARSHALPTPSDGAIIRVRTGGRASDPDSTLESLGPRPDDAWNLSPGDGLEQQLACTLDVGLGLRRDVDLVLAEAHDRRPVLLRPRLLLEAASAS